MEIVPDDYIAELDLVVVFAKEGLFFTSLTNQRKQAKRQIFVHDPCVTFDPKHHMLFDKVIQYDFNQEPNVLADILKQYIHDKNLTRFITVSDVSHLYVCSLREILNIPGRQREVIKNFLNKRICKDILKKGGVNLHKYYCPTFEECKQNLDDVIKKAEQMTEYPMYTKPTQLMSSKGHFRIQNQEDLKNAIQYYIDKNLEFEIDEFLQGQLVGMDSVIINKEIKFFVAWKNLTDYVKQYEGIPTGQLMLPYDDPLYQKLYKYLEQIIKSYDYIPNDVLDVECWLKDGEEDLIFQELQLRRTGSQVGNAIYESIGLNIEITSLALQTSNTIRLPLDDYKKRWIQYGGWIEYHLSGPIKIKGWAPLPKGLRSKIKVNRYNYENFELKEGEKRPMSVDVVIVNEDYEQLEKDWITMSKWKPYIFYQFIFTNTDIFTQYQYIQPYIKVFLQTNLSKSKFLTSF